MSMSSIKLTPAEEQIIKGMLLVREGIKSKAKGSKLFGLLKKKKQKKAKPLSPSEILDQIQDAQLKGKAQELVNAMNAAQLGVKVHAGLTRTYAKFSAFVKAAATGRPPKQVQEYYQKLQDYAEQLNAQEEANL